MTGLLHLTHYVVRAMSLRQQHRPQKLWSRLDGSASHCTVAYEIYKITRVTGIWNAWVVLPISWYFYLRSFRFNFTHIDIALVSFVSPKPYLLIREMNIEKQRKIDCEIPCSRTILKKKGLESENTTDCDVQPHHQRSPTVIWRYPMDPDSVVQLDLNVLVHCLRILHLLPCHWLAISIHPQTITYHFKQRTNRNSFSVGMNKIWPNDGKPFTISAFSEDSTSRLSNLCPRPKLLMEFFYQNLTVIWRRRCLNTKNLNKSSALHRRLLYRF